VFSISLSAYAPQLRTERGKEESLLLVLIERTRIVRKMKRFTEEKAVKYGKIGGVVTWEWRSLRCTVSNAASSYLLEKGADVNIGCFRDRVVLDAVVAGGKLE
jgi:hypothetical protein